MFKKPLLQKLPLTFGSSFLIDRFESPYFETPWHYHQEIEIVLCDGGFGKKFVGNHVSDYIEGDLAILGSNLPHWYRADDDCYQHQKPASIVIHFLDDCFGKDFFELAEMAEIKRFLETAKLGIEFYGESRARIQEKIQNLLKADKVTRMLGLIDTLHLMSCSKEYRILSENAIVGVSKKDSERMNEVFDYVLKNFKNDINLSEIANKTRFSEAAFCRYFKLRTQKTFVEFVNEIRIEYACKLLAENDLNILEICYESGFKNLSNFNRQFRKYTNNNPKTYRQLVLHQKQF
ncbi:AraC family transcriptional regulator [Emticicia oligotrophica]|uniref:AraC family transcriptional regulator n=1 Tax=Emticicia oligotrophica TaxID=312279 RepID=UPI00273B8907|nr:AraC family transcriptional regulator [Emticicia oligotrophica]